MAVELLTAVETRFHVQINPLELMGGATISDIARRVAAAFEPAASVSGK
jgi:acyl carrier protein